MNRSRIIFATVFASMLITLPALAQEKKLTKDQLPAAVQKTVEEQSKGATIRGFSTEKENGKISYEAQLTVNGKTRDISMDASGGITEVEDQVDFASLPAAVQDGL